MFAEKIAGRRIIASISGGKDSAAMALWFKEQGIEFTSVFLDTGWEHDATYEYLRGDLTKTIGPIIELRNDLVMPDLIRKKGMFPSRVKRFCTQELKVYPMQRYLKSLDDDVINAVGIRAEESESRSKMPEWEWSDGFDCEVWRPMIRWTEQEVIDIHKRHGLRPNPLYLMGASRVGCWPCIYARKNEVRLIAEIDPGRIDKLRQLETEITEQARQRDPNSGDRAWFASRLRSDPGPWSIDKVVAWSKTGYGGKGEPEPFQDEQHGCMRWGLCDTGSDVAKVVAPVEAVEPVEPVVDVPAARALHSIEEVEAAGGYQIIYADPCWPYEQRGRGAAENHYRTMSVEEIAALPVGRIAAKNAVLFIWGTWPNLFECKQVIEGWGFRYKTLGFNWVKATKNGKTAWGGGSYARANSEFCLMAVRGNMSAISHSVHQLVEEWEDREDLALRAPVGRHSQKPAVVRDRIVELFGDLPRIELFARERVAGWDAFGDDPALGGPDVDLMPRTNKEDTGRSNVVHVQFENTHTNDSNTQDNEDEEQGEDTMGQMPESVRKRIAKSRANAGGTNIRHGEYILMYWKSSYDRMNSGNCHINEFVVVQAKKIVVVEGETQKEVEPNQVGTMCSYVINYDGKGKLSADGNSKAIILGMFGLEEKPDDEKQIAELDQALADLTADSQPAKGMLIKLTTYAKEVRSRPGNFITGMKWACVDRPGTGENTVEKAASRVAQFQAMQAQQQQAQQNQQLSA